VIVTCQTQTFCEQQNNRKDWCDG